MPLALYHEAHLDVDGGTARLITALDVTPADVPEFALVDRLCNEHEGTTGRHVRTVPIVAGVPPE